MTDPKKEEALDFANCKTFIRWTVILIKDVQVWTNRKFGEIKYYVTQMKMTPNIHYLNAHDGKLNICSRFNATVEPLNANYKLSFDGAGRQIKNVIHSKCYEKFLTY